MRLALFVKLKFQSSTIILSAVIEYSVRDLLSDIDNYADPTRQVALCVTYGK